LFQLTQTTGEKERSDNGNGRSLPVGVSREDNKHRA